MEEKEEKDEKEKSRDGKRHPVPNLGIAFCLFAP